MIRSGKASGRNDLLRKRTKAPLHPVADDGASNLLRDGEADAHRRIRILAIPNEQDEAGGRSAHPAVCSEKVDALSDRA
jgi:hypothetical protein